MDKAALIDAIVQERRVPDGLEEDPEDARVDLNEPDELDELDEEGDDT
jgi:hypothetical protein